MNSATTSPMRKVIPLSLLIAIVAVASFIVVVKSGYLKSWAQVSLKSIPSGALVLMDGKPIGAAPTTLTDIPAGIHEFRFILSGYRVYSVSKTCVDNVEITARLERLPAGRLEFVSEPDGATVFINGVNHGKTPFGLELAPGRHTVSLLKENYEEYLSEVEVKPSETTSLDIVLISSIEYYYKDQILAEPTNLVNYADLMRFYYVKGRYEEMAELIFEGFAHYYNQRNTDPGRRFVQELSTIRSEDVELYNSKIFEVIYPHLVEYCTDATKTRDVCDTLLLDLRNVAVGLPLLNRIFESDWDKKVILTYVTDTYSKGYAAVMRMPSRDFSSMADGFLAAEKTLDAKFFFERLYDLGLMSSKKLDYAVAEKVWRKVLEIFPDNRNIMSNITAVRKLFDTFVALRKYTDAAELLTTFLERTDIPDRYRDELQKELDKLKKNLQI